MGTQEVHTHERANAMKTGSLGIMHSKERHPPSTPLTKMTPELGASCDCCRGVLEGGSGFRCAVCAASVRVCPHCGESDLQHRRFLTPSRQSMSSQRSKAEQMRMLQLWLSVLAHAAGCGPKSCGVRVCIRMKHLFHHVRHCQASLVEGDCRHCKTYSVLLRKHAKQCTAANCPVPQCPGASDSGDEGSVTSPDSALTRDDD